MKSVLLGIVFLFCAALYAGPVVKVCNGNGSVDVKFTVEYNKPYWYVNAGNTTVRRIFRYDENTRRILPMGSSNWVYELKRSTPNRLVNNKGKVILEYRNGNISKPGTGGSAIAVLRRGQLYRGGTVNCVANFRNGNLPTGLALTIAAQYYLSKELGIKPVNFAPQPIVVNLKILSLPFNKQAVTKFYAGDKKDGKILYTFRNGFIYEGDAVKDDRNKALYAVCLDRLANVGKQKNVPYIITFYDLKKKHSQPVYTFQSIVRYALFPGNSIYNAPLFHLGPKGEVFPGSQKKTAVGCINSNGSKLYRGTKAEGKPVLSIVGNRRNFWVEMFIWNKVLEKDIADYLKANPEAKKPFPVKKKK